MPKQSQLVLRNLGCHCLCKQSQELHTLLDLLFVVKYTDIDGLMQLRVVKIRRLPTCLVFRHLFRNPSIDHLRVPSQLVNYQLQKAILLLQLLGKNGQFCLL